MIKTYFPKGDDTQTSKSWVLVDAAGKVVGRLASEIASILRGKNKPSYSPHADMGDFVVVVNAEKVVFTGQKLKNKRYFRHTGYAGGVVEETVTDFLSSKPEEILKHAVKGMLPKTALGRQQFTKLKVYSGGEHPHAAQQPVAI